MADITMPKLSDTMEEGKILRWLKEPGEEVSPGEILVEVETDKADMEVEAEHGGVLREIRLKEGDSAPVGAVIAVIEAGGEKRAEKPGAAPERASARRKDEPRAERQGNGAAAEPAGEARGARRSDAVAEAAEEGAEAPDESESFADAGRGDGAGDDGATDEAASDGEAPPRRTGAAKAQPAEARDRTATRESEPDEERAAGDGDAEAAPGEAQAGRAGHGAPQAQRRGRAEAGRAPAATPASRAGPRVSPLARTRAAELGIDPTTVRGTGPAGRVTRKDVEEASRAAAPAEAPEATDATEAKDAKAASEAKDAKAAPEAKDAEAAPEAKDAKAAPEAKDEKAAPASGTVRVRPVERAPRAPAGAEDAKPAAAEARPGDVRRIPLSGMRASIARRMSESKREAPHFYVTSVVDMDLAVRLRAALKESGEAAAGVTYNHLVLKATADALAAIPEMNARFAGDAIEVLPEVNLGVATALPDGLIVPVIHSADRLSLLELAARARELGERARTRSFTREDLSGATFSVSNLGMYDVESFIAVINPPQAGILAVGSVRETAVVRAGEIRVGHTLHLTVSCDHRAVDGTRAAEFLAEVRRRLENPMLLLLGSGEG